MINQLPRWLIKHQEIVLCPLSLRCAHVFLPPKSVATAGMTLMRLSMPALARQAQRPGWGDLRIVCRNLEVNARLIMPMAKCRMAERVVGLASLLEIMVCH